MMMMMMMMMMMWIAKFVYRKNRWKASLMNHFQGEREREREREDARRKQYKITDKKNKNESIKVIVELDAGLKTYVDNEEGKETK